jgi:hypothetical protein
MFSRRQPQRTKTRKKKDLQPQTHADTHKRFGATCLKENTIILHVHVHASRTRLYRRLGRACETQQNAFPGGDKPLALRVIGLNTIHSRAKAPRKSPPVVSPSRRFVRKRFTPHLQYLPAPLFPSNLGCALLRRISIGPDSFCLGPIHLKNGICFPFFPISWP